MTSSDGFDRCTGEVGFALLLALGGLGFAVSLPGSGADGAFGLLFFLRGGALLESFALLEQPSFCFPVVLPC